MEQDGGSIVQRYGVDVRVARLQVFGADVESGTTVTTGRRQPWKEIKPSDAAGLAGASAIVFTPDGQSFATTYVRVLSELYTVEGIR